MPLVNAAPASVPAMYHPPARPRRCSGTNVAIRAPTDAHVQVLKAVAKVASIVNTGTLPEGSATTANASISAVENPLTMIMFRRFQPKSTSGAHKNERKNGVHAMALTDAI